MKNTSLAISMLAALAPLATACAPESPVDHMPAEAMLGAVAAPEGGAVAAPEDGAAALAVEVEAKPSAHPHSRIFPRQATPFGRTYEEWAASWWQWALAIPKDQNPMRGGPCDIDQSGKVFYLAGTTGGSDTRSCTIPPGKALFLPILNWAYMSCPEYTDEFYTCELAMSDENLLACVEWAAEYYDRTMTLEIDGVVIDDLSDYYAQSDVFQADAPAEWDDRIFPACTGAIRENTCGVPVGSPRSSVTGGYWVMLRPLPPGEHQIRFTGTDGSFSLDVTYDIVVSPH